MNAPARRETLFDATKGKGRRSGCWRRSEAAKRRSEKGGGKGVAREENAR